MNILFLTHNYPRWAGDYSGVFLHLLARRLKDEGVAVTVLAPHDAGAELFETMDGVPVHRFRYHKDDSGEDLAYRGDMQRRVLNLRGAYNVKYRFLASFKEKAAEVLSGQQFDVLAVHWVTPTGLIAAGLVKEFRLPIVLHSHGTDVRLLTKFSPLVKHTGGIWGFNFAVAEAKRWTVVSTFLQKRLAEKFSEDAHKILIAPLPNDESVFYPDPSVLRAPSHLVSVTRFIEQKRPLQLVSAAKTLVERGLPFSLDIYGAGTLREEVSAQIAQHGLSQQIRIHEPVPQARLRAVYSKAAGVILNSVDEGFGLTLVEGALCGALPIGVRSGGITDIIEHDKTGLLAEPDNPQSLAEMMARLITDDALTSRLASAAKESALVKFTGRASARVYADVYRQAAVDAQ